ncbi:carbon-nitrogen hydrolase family protein [Pararobbsia silviterrae]|nr:carbon-nitrogen hydrolase family protein [Pararobbsia silviterrae]
MVSASDLNVPQAPIRVAVAQTDPRLNDVPHNQNIVRQMTLQAAEQDAKLVVFPECMLTGYCFASRQEGLDNGLDIDGPEIADVIRLAAQTQMHIALGFVEVDRTGATEKLYNTAVLITPQGRVHAYRKVHLPDLGVDRFVDTGDLPITVFDTDIGRIAFSICYEARFPEHSRVLALQGVQLLLHITNLPRIANAVVDVLLPARALENHVFVLSSGRIGLERNYQFLGHSRIFGLQGEILARASGDTVELITADLSPAQADLKTQTIDAQDGKPDPHQFRMFSDRHPELYGLISHSN